MSPKILTSQSLDPNSTFNWVFLIELLVSGILVLFFLFYFNRLFATLISYGVRAYSWHKFRIYIDIQALQISLLGGRIFFKGFRYHGENETILIQHGYLTWRYWLHSVKQVDGLRFSEDAFQYSDHGDGEEQKTSQSGAGSLSGEENGNTARVQNLPCRIAVSLSGLEWFIYNRSPAYDAIFANGVHGTAQHGIDEELANQEKDAASRTSGADRGLSNTEDETGTKSTNGYGKRRLNQRSSEEQSEIAFGDEEAIKSAESLSLHETTSSRPPDPRLRVSTPPAPVSPILKLLPVWLECQKGAIVLGNETTRAIMTTTFVRARGQVDAAKAESSLDSFRQIFDFEIEHPVVQMKPNHDFRRSQQSTGESLIYKSNLTMSKRKRWTINQQFQHRKRRAWHNLRNLLPYFRRSVESFHPSPQYDSEGFNSGTWAENVPGESQWVGLTRYLDPDDKDDHAGWTDAEYAKDSNILDCPNLHLKFYWDVPGKVPHETAFLDNARKVADINGSQPPGYGLDLVLRGGHINYGPWTDRLRAEIQSAFFPNPFKDSEPAKQLQPGAYRQSTTMKIHIEIEEEVNLRVPTRESSKDWQWKGRAGALRDASKLKRQKTKRNFRQRKSEQSTLGPDIRPFGWFSFFVAADSTINFEMDMVAREHGYGSYLDLDLKETKVSSSVNHGLLWRSGPKKVTCDLSNPLGWNTLHQWTFTIRTDAMELFLLRDHMFLLTDLITDFGSGAGPDYMTFVPFHYHIKLLFNDLKLYLNANDSNIIDNPAELEDNTFLVFNLQELDASVDIPLINYSPAKNAIAFKAEGRNGEMDLITPVWHTLHTFVSDRPVGTLKELSLDGTYNYCSSNSPQLTDTLLLNVSGMSPKVYLFGFLVRYFMKVKDNYFGDDMHFKTLEEFQEMLASGNDQMAEHNHDHSKTSNDLDVILSVRADRSCALLPANIYSRKDNVRFDILLVEADMRFSNYYMDMATRFSPIEASLESFSTEDIGVCDYHSNTQLFVDGVNIYGHRLFGAPPSEPTYVCNWDFDVGEVLGECSATFVRTLGLALGAITFTLDDEENALPLSHVPIIHDITFLRAQVESIRLWFLADDTALLVGTDHIEVAFNDWAGTTFSDRAKIKVPELTLAAVDLKGATRHRDQIDTPVTTHAYFRTSVDLSIVERKLNFEKDRALQQQHVQLHDQRTHRADWLLHHNGHNGMPRNHKEFKGNPPAMPIPSMPEPASNEMLEVCAEDSPLYTGKGTRMHHKVSFLSGGSLSEQERLAKINKRRPVLHKTSSTRSRNDESKFLNIPKSVSRLGKGSEKLEKPRPDQMRANTNSTFSAGTVTHSSPWSAPHFSLQRTSPDVTRLPIIPSSATQKDKQTTNPVEAETFSSMHDSSKTSHTSLLINIAPGLTGFCTPQFFDTVSRFISKIRPTHPVDLLDQVQLDTMSKVVDMEQVQSKVPKITDCAVKIPFMHLRMINSDSDSGDSSESKQRDQYDLIISQARITLRSHGHIDLSGDHHAAEHALLTYVVANEVSVVVSEDSADAMDDMATARGIVKDISFWLASQDQKNAKLQLRIIEIATWGRRVEYLASLIHRTTAMVERIIDGFEDSEHARSLQYLVHCLTLQGAEIADPIFLTRPSYVLRSAGDHFRHNDSWKMISRLRQIYRALPRTAQEKLVAEVMAGHNEIPGEAEAQVLAYFDQWRNWDLAHVRGSPVMKSIWGEAPMEKGPRKLDPVYAEASIGHAKAILDPGPKQNEVVFGDTDIAFSLISGAPKNPSSIFDDDEGPQLISIQSYCSRFAVNLNWELFELVGDTLERFKSTESEAPPIERSLSQAPREAQLVAAQSQEIHVVFGTDKGSITFDTINLTLALSAENLKGSIIHAVDVSQGRTSSVLISSSSASAKLKSGSRFILGWQLFPTNLYAAFEEHSGSRFREPSALRLAATCRRLRFEMREDVMNVLSLAHRVIGNEVELVRGLMTRLDDGIKPSSALEIDTRSSQDIHIAMFLDDYYISVALLPSLTYNISGKVARTSVTPRHDNTLIVDFDLKRQVHDFQSDIGEHHRERLSVLNIPPINGKVNIDQGDSKIMVDVDTTFEKIELEAAAVRSSIDTLNKPEIVRLVVDAQKSAQNAVSRVQELFAISETPAVSSAEKEAGKLLQYIAHVTFAGLGIHCRAPGLKSDDYRADLDFNLGLATVHLHNRTADDNAVHERPQFDVSVRQLGLELRRRDRQGVATNGKILFSAHASGITEYDDRGNQVQVYRASSEGFAVDLYPETATLAVDVATFLQERIRSLTLSDEVKRPLRRLTIAGLTDRPIIKITPDDNSEEVSSDAASTTLFDSVYSLELNAIQVRWIVNTVSPISPGYELEDLIFSIHRIDLGTKREGTARLAVADLQLQMVPKSGRIDVRSSNSALLPEVIFNAAYLSTKQDRRLAFQVVGKALDLQLASDFIVPATVLRNSVVAASKKLREAEAFAVSGPVSTRKGTTNLWGSKRLASLLVDADFAGAVVNVRARREEETRSSAFGILKGKRRSRAGRYHQAVQGDSANQATLRAPGIAMKVEYGDTGKEDPSLSAQIKVAASSNVLYPSVVPLIIEISSSIKEIVGDPDSNQAATSDKEQPQKNVPDSSLGGADASAVFKEFKLNIGLWIGKQEFSLSCQPIARVAATARFEDIFMTVNTVQAPDQHRFFALLMTFNKLQASVQHVYSRESTASFEVDSIMVSIMNSKHVSTSTGVSAILNITPMNASINAKQLQDFLLFREIWYPTELRQAAPVPDPVPVTNNNQAYAVLRYQQVAAAGAFPWNAVVSIQQLNLQLDLGQGLGKSVFNVSKLWAYSKKNSDWEQNLCLGFESVGVECTGRMSGFVELQNFRARTSIRWPLADTGFGKAPLVQASLGFDHLQVKAAFDYQPFAIANISTFEFIMYNVRQSQDGENDRLVGILDGDKVQVYCTSSAAAQALALYQAVERLIQEKEAAYEASLKELDKYLRRRSVFPTSPWASTAADVGDDLKESLQGPFSLHTDVLVILKEVNFGAYSSTFYDNQIFKVEATDARARFAVSAKDSKTHSKLELTLGQFRVALANVNRANTQALGEVSVSDVISRAAGSRGGTILRVPKAVAAMQTWQMDLSNHIDYIFKSTFEGKVDVSWNYSRISFIRGMWSSHSRALAQRLGKPLTQSAVKITAEPQPSDEKGKEKGQEKIRAVVNVPQSRFEYTALEPPIIQTPQLRDMGEATPPLEWIGLHRDRLPHVTHQIIIVTLLEIAREVEDAYSKILGST